MAGEINKARARKRPTPCKQAKQNCCPPLHAKLNKTCHDAQWFSTLCQLKAWGWERIRDVFAPLSKPDDGWGHMTWLGEERFQHYPVGSLLKEIWNFHRIEPISQDRALRSSMSWQTRLVPFPTAEQEHHNWLIFSWDPSMSGGSEWTCTLLMRNRIKDFRLFFFLFQLPHMPQKCVVLPLQRDWIINTIPWSESILMQGGRFGKVCVKG